MRIATRESLLADLVGGGATPSGRAWFEQVAFSLRESFDREAFLEAFAAAARRLGRTVVVPAPEQGRALQEAGGARPVGAWAIDDLARIALLLRAAASLPASDFDGLIEACYAQGDIRERQAVLRALPFLEEGGRHLRMAIEACRTHIQPLFEAIACENPYPARHFPDLNFNQMVLKALFTGVALERIVGLKGRSTPELARMAGAYASERLAAGRSVPPDIERITADPGSPR